MMILGVLLSVLLVFIVIVGVYFNKTKKNVVLGILLSVALMLIVFLGTYFNNTTKEWPKFRDRVGVSTKIELTSTTMDPSWIISGMPKFNSLQYATSHDNSSFSGLWEAIGPAKFEFHYKVDESIFILEGSAEIEYLGKRIMLEEGNSMHFLHGTVAIWTVPERIKKTWWIHSPSRLVRLRADMHSWQTE